MEEEDELSPALEYMDFVRLVEYLISASRHMKQWKDVNGKDNDMPFSAEYELELANYKLMYQTEAKMDKKG